MIGTRLSHYEILEHLGAGGMGVVYRARDERLEREVAIKVLPAGALADDSARKQFRKEALALSKLNHPNIATVHDFDSQGGVDFLVMEMVRGVTLSKRLAAGGLIPEEEIARIGGQMAEGLAAAHQEGVLHRDIKPGNLRITPEGRLKILDFGLAKLVRRVGERTTTETVTGVEGVAGTLPYMSPEQLRGERLDPRTDVYSAGAVLYEIACGRRAFPQEAAPAVVGAILGQPPISLRELSPTISADLEGIILRCLEKEPGRRYSSASDLGADLREIATPSRRRLKGRRRPALPAAIAGAALVALVALVLALDVGGLRERIVGARSPAAKSIAVLPLVNLSRDPSQEYFADGMTDELITRLAQVGALRVISRSSVMQFKGAKKPLRDIARELHVGMIVEGTVVQVGEQVRITAQLIDVPKDSHLWADSYQRSLSDVLALQSEVARAIVENVRVRLTPGERARLASAPTVKPEALRACLLGQSYRNQSSEEGLRNALEQFQRAVAIDPGYAPAYVGLSDTYQALSGSYLPSGEAMPRARAAASKALELDPQLASAHASLANTKIFLDWDWSGAEQGFREALRLNPSDALAHQVYGGLLIMLGRFRESEAEFARARELDPLSRDLAAMSLWPLFEGRQFDRAIAAAERLIQADPSAYAPHMILGQALLFGGRHARAIAEFRRAAELEPKLTFLVGWLAYAYARSGDRTKARELLDRLREWNKRPEFYVQPYVFALVLVGLGQRAEALDWLEKSFAAHSDELTFLNVDPAMDPLRAEPRFQALLKRLGLPP